MPSNDQPLRRLANLVRPALLRGGATWQEVGALRGFPINSAPLPLYTALWLGGEPLQQFLEVKTEKRFDEFLDVYESYIGAYVANRTNNPQPQLFFQKELDLTKEDALNLFYCGRHGLSKLSYRDAALNLIPLAAVALYSFGGDLDETETTFKVSVDGMKFGIEKQAPISNMGTALPTIPFSWCRDGLSQVRRGRGRYAGSPEDLNAVMAWAQLNAEKLGEEHAAVNLALQILRWRSRNKILSTLYKGLTDLGRNASLAYLMPVLQGLTEAGNWEDLRRHLVPGYIGSKRFIQMFGQARATYPLTPYMKNKWLDSLSRLSQGESFDD